MLKKIIFPAVFLAGTILTYGQEPAASPTSAPITDRSGERSSSAVPGQTQSVQGKVVKQQISKGLLNGKALKLPKPTYPLEARAARARGTVGVQVLIDEEGKVIHAVAFSGDPLLYEVSVEAAKLAVFSPTLMDGEPVRVSGTITYNFIPATLKERALNMGMSFSILRSENPGFLLRKDKTVQEYVKVFGKDIPDEVEAEKSLFDELASSSDRDRTALAGKLFEALKPHMNEEEKWRLEAGFYLGNIIIEIKRQIEIVAAGNTAFDTSNIKSQLRLINSLLVSVPQGVPPELVEKLKIVGAYESVADIGTPETAKALWGDAYTAVSSK